jgi:hypothetical protein
MRRSIEEAEQRKAGQFQMNVIRVILGSFASSCVALVFLVTSVHAKEYDYAISYCGSGTTTLVSQTDEITIFSYDMKGITWSTHPTDKAFDKSTYHCVGIVRTGRGGLANHGYCKYMEPDGDFVTGEYTATGPEGRWQFLEGTGKYNDIKGGGPNQPFVSGKAIVPGTSQGCRRATGKYTLPD